MSCENCMGKFDEGTMERVLLNWDKEDLISYLKTHFPIEGQKNEEWKNIVRVIKNLDEDVLISAIARIKALEKIYEYKHMTSFLGTFLAATIPTILSFSDVLPINKIYLRLGATLFAVFTLRFFLKGIVKDKNVIAVLISVRELLEQALVKKTKDEIV
ncbi:hypothetical protein [Bacillus pumilus]|uniref:hypothetical protein n=1 Tax=Bacillus pumilus TaxID=1408 RepID=UPI0011A39B16|nr:hypothetical protein [Bacillus pumilus]